MQENNCMFLEILQGQKIARDGDLVSATDMWRLAGRPENKKPKYWLRFSTTREYILFLKKNLPRGDLKSPLEVVKIERGQRGNCHVYIHYQLALQYAAYLSIELRQAIFTTFERVFKADITLAAQIYDKATIEQKKWLDARNQGKKYRTDLTDCLQRHGVAGKGFAICTNKLYEGLFNKTAQQLRLEQEARVSSLVGTNTRDRMTTQEIGSIGFAELLSTKRIEKHDSQGTAQCSVECKRAGSDVAKLLESD